MSLQSRKTGPGLLFLTHEHVFNKDFFVPFGQPFSFSLAKRLKTGEKSKLDSGLRCPPAILKLTN